MTLFCNNSYFIVVVEFYLTGKADDSHMNVLNIGKIGTIGIGIPSKFCNSCYFVFRHRFQILFSQISDFTTKFSNFHYFYAWGSCPLPPAPAPPPLITDQKILNEHSLTSQYKRSFNSAVQAPSGDLPSISHTFVETTP